MPEAGSQRLSFAGTLTLQDSAALKDAILTRWSAGGGVELDLAAVSEAHFSIVQVVEAARRSAASGDREFRLAAPVSEAVRSLAVRAGLSGTPDGAEFWNGREGAGE